MYNRDNFKDQVSWNENGVEKMKRMEQIMYSILNKDLGPSWRLKYQYNLYQGNMTSASSSIFWKAWSNEGNDQKSNES